MASEAQIRANRLNAARSTGPKSDPGKRRSRANALKHGLCASAVVPESLELIRQRALECYNGLKPQDRYQCWIVDQVAVLTLRVDRSERMERRARDKVALRACLSWDDDRTLEAKVLGGRLAGNPEEVVEALRRTPHGCEWLIDRWSRLAGAAREATAWTDEQARLALDLLATPPAFRDGRKPWAAADPAGDSVAPGGDLVAFALRQVEELERRRALALEVDEVERALAEADLTDGANLETRRLRRYESAIHRKLRWYIAQLQNPTPHAIRQPHLEPAWSDEYAPILPPQTEDEKAAEGWTPDQIHPPFDLEPDEYPGPGQSADIPKIVQSRKDKKLARAESRREARRRKLDQLRA